MSGNLSFDGRGTLKQNPDSAGGMQFVLFVPVKDIQTFGTYDHATGYHSGLSLFGTGNYYTAELPPTGRGYAEEQKEGEGGIYYDINVTGLLPFASAENELKLEALAAERYVLLVQLPNNIIKIIGTPDSPARFAHAMNTGQTIKGIPATDIGFNWQSDAKPPMFSPNDFTVIYRNLLAV